MPMNRGSAVAPPARARGAAAWGPACLRPPWEGTPCGCPWFLGLLVGSREDTGGRLERHEAHACMHEYDDYDDDDELTTT